jgi:SWIM zinc finger
MITKTLPTRNVVRLKALQRASRRLEVVRVSDGAERYLVSSAARNGRFYEVVIDPATLSGRCSCPWAQYGGVNCKHVLAVLREYFAPKGALSFWSSPEAARRQHRPIIAGDHLLATLRKE